MSESFSTLISSLRDWSQREAMLLIEERQSKGLPLSDPNYIPPEKVNPIG